MDRYRLPEQALYFMERRSWHRLPHPRFHARDLLRPRVLQKQESDRPTPQASIPGRTVALPRDKAARLESEPDDREYRSASLRRCYDQPGGSARLGPQEFQKDSPSA